MNRRATIIGCMAIFCVSTATAGERSPGDDRRNDGNRLGRQREWREQWHGWKRDWQYARPPSFYDHTPFYGFPPFPRPRRRYVDPWAAYDRCMWKYDDTWYCDQFVLRRW
jgi:hypothetical protein